MTDLLLLFGVSMIINGFCMTLDGRKMRQTALELRKKGEIISGEQKGLLFLRTYYVLMAIDQSGKIIDARMQKSGFLYPGKTEKLPSINGKNIHCFPAESDGINPFVMSACKTAIRKYLRMQLRKQI